MKRSKTIQDVCDRFGVKRPTVRAWVRRGCPHDRGEPGRPNRYDLREVTRWLKREGLNSAGGRPRSPESIQRELWQVRKIRAQALRHEHELAEARRQLVKQEQVDQAWADVYRRLKAALLTGWGETLRRLRRDNPTPAEMEKALHDELNSRLQALCKEALSKEATQ